jgi:hypothetical protein
VGDGAFKVVGRWRDAVSVAGEIHWAAERLKVSRSEVEVVCSMHLARLVALRVLDSETIRDVVVRGVEAVEKDGSVVGSWAILAGYGAPLHLSRTLALYRVLLELFTGSSRAGTAIAGGCLLILVTLARRGGYSPVVAAERVVARVEASLATMQLGERGRNG